MHFNFNRSHEYFSYVYNKQMKRNRLQNYVLESVQLKPQNSARWPTLTIVHSLNITYKFNVKNLTEEDRKYRQYSRNS